MNKKECMHNKPRYESVNVDTKDITYSCPRCNAKVIINLEKKTRMIVEDTDIDLELE